MDRAQLAPAAAIQIAPNTELSLHQWRMLSDVSFFNILNIDL